MSDHFGNAAYSYDDAAFLARETGQRMAERLDYVKLAPLRIADIGCATGDGIRNLQTRYPTALPLAIDLALPMLRRVRERTSRLSRIIRRGPRLINADVNALPLAQGAIDLAWSNLMLHWLADPLPAFKELHRVLAIDGLLMFSALGPDTLKELREAAAHAGVADTVRRFIDMHDLGDMLLAAGFADPVMDMEVVTLTYRSSRGFLADQRHLGVVADLLGALGWRDCRRLFAAWARNSDGLFPATFEIVYGHAWKPVPRKTSDGRAVLTFHPAKKFP